jgi:50S ribosomal protein L16 3-hydroxylase
LYIPPGFPHDGVALEESMSFSVGFRAKSACDMLSGLADYMIDKELGKALFSDPKRAIHQHQGHINGSDFAMIQAHLQTVLENPKLLADFAGSYFSKTKCALDLQTLDEALTEKDLVVTLMEQPLIRTGGLRCFYVDETVAQGVCYIDGERFEFGDTLRDVVIALCDNDSLNYELIQYGLNTPAFLTQLTEWTKSGFWYFQD